MSASSTLAFEAAVFDCDGTLVHTTACWRHAYLRAVGEPVSDELLNELAGASTRMAAGKLSKSFGRTISPRAIEDGLMEAAQEGPFAPLEGVVELLEFLRERGIPTAVATNGPKRFAHAVLGERLAGFFRRVLASEELPGMPDKPNPDVYLVALADLEQRSPTRAVAFEDAKVGALSANAAQIPLVFLNAELREPPPDVEYRIFVHSLAEPKLYQFLEGRDGLL